LALALVFTTIVAGAVLGLAAAARASGSEGNVSVSLRTTTRTTAGRAWRRTQEGLVTLQIALALSLLLAAGLMASSLAKLNRVDLGFEPAGGSKFTLHLPFRPYPTFQRTAAFHLSVLEALRTIPGVTAVGAAMQFPSTPQSLYSHPRLEARNALGEVKQALITANVVSPDYFKTMGIRLISGRTFQAGDLSAPTPGVVLSTALARHLFGSDDPLGREVRIKLPAYRVVGVSGDVYSDRPIEGALRVLYFPLLNDLSPTSAETEQRIPFMPAGMTFVVKGTQVQTLTAATFRQAVSSIDPRVPLWDIRSLDALVRDSTARTRLTMLLLGIAALATLLLGAIGLYSVIAYAVVGRTREFAVRLAIGAAPREIMQQVLREGAAVAAIGVAVGLALSFAGARILRDLVYEVSPTDPLMYAAAAFVVLLSTAVATYSPARRAGNINPVGALHGE
jgi:putative ABC transport system permease protein